MKWERFEPSHNRRREQWWDAGRAQLLWANSVKNGLRSSSNTSYIMGHFPEAPADSSCAHVSASSLFASAPCATSCLYTRCCDKTRWRLKWPASSHRDLELERPLHPISLWDKWVCTAFMCGFSPCRFFFFFCNHVTNTKKNRTAQHHLHTVIASGMKGKQHLKEDSVYVEHKSVGVWGVWLY